MIVNPRLHLKTSRRTAVFRLVERLLKTDPELANGKVRTWRSWEGSPKDDDPPVPAQCPWVRLSRAVSPAGPRDEQSQAATLVIRIELATKGTNADDPADLWAAVEDALVPRDVEAQRALRVRFRELGAETGVIKVGQPADETTRAEHESGVMLLATGTILIDYRVSGV